MRPAKDFDPLQIDQRLGKLPTPDLVDSVHVHSCRLLKPAIGMDLPPILIALARFENIQTAPEQAIDAGFIDEVVDIEDLEARSMTVAEKLAQLPQPQYATNKLSIRADKLQTMRDSLEELKNHS